MTNTVSGGEWLHFAQSVTLLRPLLIAH